MAGCWSGAVAARAVTVPKPRIALLTFGSRGDTQPFLALALALQRAGARPVLGAHPVFRGLIEGHGVPYAELAGDPHEWMRSQARLRAMVRSPAVLTAAREFAVEWAPTMRTMLEQSADLVRASDAIVFAHGALAGPHLHEALGKPTAFASLQPWDITAEYPSVTMRQAARSAGAARRIFNRASHWMGEQVVWFPWRWTVNRWRREQLGLDGVPFFGTPWRRMSDEVVRLYGYSPHVAPPPADWPDDRFVSGWWRLPHAADWRPAPALSAFLAAGEKPVYVGFGSHLPVLDVAQVEDAVTSVARQLGLRLVLAAGWAGLGGSSGVERPRPRVPNRQETASSDVFVLDEAPHDWLFPRMRAVVHHGGAGTTGAAAHAGVPQVAVPAFFDQYYWSAKIRELGVGTRLVTPKFSGAGLRAALEVALSPQVAVRAAQVAEVVAREAGAQGAARYLLRRFGFGPLT